MTDLPCGRDLDALLAQAGWVRSLALQLCADVHAAEDAAQDAWLAAAKRPPREAGKLRGYLARTLRNVLRMNGRAAQRRVRHEGAAAAVDAHAQDTAELITRAELHRQLVAAVLELPPPQRDLVLWHWFDGVEVGELARRLDKSPDAVRALLRRAREQLRQGLERRGSLHALGAFVTQLPAGASLLPAVITGGILMKGKSIAVAAGVAAVALCVVVPVAISTRGSGAGAAPPAAAAPVVADDRAAAVSPEAPAPVLVREEAKAGRLVVRGRLDGLHARLPWTASLVLRTTSATGGTTEQRIVVADDGSFTVPLTNEPGAAVHVRVSADDQWYLPVAHDADVGAHPNELLVRVAPEPIVFGSVTDDQGRAIAGAEVLAYATTGGVPAAKQPPITNAVTATDGTFWLKPGATAECIVAALAAADRADVVPAASGNVTVNGIVELAPIVLPAAAPVTGVVRWENGVAVRSATVEWRAKSAIALGGAHELGWCTDGTLTRNRETEVDAGGRFTLPARAGSAGNVFTSLVEGNRPADWMMIRQAIAPKDVEVRIAGRPITIRVLKDGAPAPKVGVEWRRGGSVPVANVAANYGTDENGELKQLVLDESFRVRAVDPARELVSEWAEFANGPPELVVLNLQPMPGETVAVRLTGAGTDALTHVAFSWHPAEGPAIPKIAAAEDGKFVMRVPVGRYRLRVMQLAGGQAQYLLRSDHDVVIPAPDVVTLAVELGGKLSLVITAADGSFVPGGYRLTDRTGAQWPRASREEPTPGKRQMLAPFPGKGPVATTVMPAGTYELVLDLGERGEHRQSVEVTAGATTDVRIKLP